MNTTKSRHFILKKYFFFLLNALYEYVMFCNYLSFIHKMCLRCYLRYILPSEIESFLKGIIIMFLATAFKRT